MNLDVSEVLEVAGFVRVRLLGVDGGEVGQIGKGRM